MSKLRIEYDRPSILRRGWRGWLFAYSNERDLGYRFLRVFGITIMLDNGVNQYDQS